MRVRKWNNVHVLHFSLLFFLHTHLLSSFRTSRGHRRRPFSPPLLALDSFNAHRVLQSHCSSIFHRVLLHTIQRVILYLRTDRGTINQYVAGSGLERAPTQVAVGCANEHTHQAKGFQAVKPAVWGVGRCSGDRPFPHPPARAFERGSQW